MAKQKYEVIGREKMFNESTLAIIKIDKDSIFLPKTSFINTKGGRVIIQRRLECSREIPGGFILIFVYGAIPNDIGKKLPVKIIFCRKVIKNIKTGKKSNIYYCDAEIIRGAKTNLTFAMRDTIDPLDPDTPCFKITFNGKPPTFVGFAKRK